MRFEFFVALRYLRAKRGQTLVSVISAISVLGIAAGVFALVVALALSTGFKEDIQEKIVGATSHVNLLRTDAAPFTDYEPLLERLARVPHVTGSAPAIFDQVFVVGNRSQGAVLKGIDPRRERTVSDFFAHIIEGDATALGRPAPAGADPDAPPPPASLIVGKEMARALGLHAGDTVRILVPRGKLTPLGMSAGSRSFRVAAVFESGLWDYDANWAYTDLVAARRLFGFQSGSASVLQFRTDDLEAVDAIADALRAAAGSGVTTTTWIDLNRPLFSALKLEKLALFVTIGLIVFVASLNIVTTLILMVMDKARDIAILTAMGATDRAIMIVFVVQGLVIGIIGTVCGGAAGVVACRVMDKYRLIRLAAEVYSIPYVPFHVKPWDVLLVIVTALAISFLATIYPARNAARLDPVEVLRYE
jgi:lipoprotein-releasing system permease protein